MLTTRLRPIFGGLSSLIDAFRKRLACSMGRCGRCAHLEPLRWMRRREDDESGQMTSAIQEPAGVYLRRLVPTACSVLLCEWPERAVELPFGCSTSASVAFLGVEVMFLRVQKTPVFDDDWLLCLSVSLALNSQGRLDGLRERACVVLSRDLFDMSSVLRRRFLGGCPPPPSPERIKITNRAGHW